MKYMKSSEVGSESGAGSKKINWNDYNYPICLKIFHYDSDETPEVLVRRVRLLRINHLLIIFTCLWNFINNIVGAVQGAESGPLRIAISIFSALIWFPIALYLFSIPYRIYMKEEESACVFYVLSGLAFTFFFLWSIADFGDANGWIMFGKHATSSRGAAAFFSFLSSIFCTVIAVLTLINLFNFCKREDD